MRTVVSLAVTVCALLIVSVSAHGTPGASELQRRFRAMELYLPPLGNASNTTTTTAASVTSEAPVVSTTGVAPATATTVAPPPTTTMMASTTTALPVTTTSAAANTTAIVVPTTSMTDNATTGASSTTTTMAPTTTSATPSNYTSTAAVAVTTTTAPATSTMAPTTTAAPTPLVFTLTFESNDQALAFATNLAEAYNIPVSDIDILSADDGTVKFQFLGDNAGLLSQQFNDTPVSTLLADYGITSRQASPVDDGSGDGDSDDDDTRLILFIVIPIGAVIIIVAVVLVVRHNVSGGSNGRVGFQEYVTLQEQQKERNAGTSATTPQRRGTSASADDEMSRML